MFNLLTVSTLLPIELLFHPLEKVSGLLVEPIETNKPNAKEPELLNALTKPLTDAIIQIDKHLLDKIATNQTSDNISLIKRNCSKIIQSNEHYLRNIMGRNNSYFEAYQTTDQQEDCFFLFKNVNWPDWLIGTLLLLFSLITLSTCLVMMVKILSSIMNGPVARFIQNFVNSDLPGVFRHFTGLVAILVIYF
jgi:sodium-dependent phosphate cotransporter